MLDVAYYFSDTQNQVWNSYNKLYSQVDEVNHNNDDIL